MREGTRRWCGSAGRGRGVSRTFTTRIPVHARSDDCDPLSLPTTVWRCHIAQVKDPVCGMTIDSNSAAASSSYQGQAYYFCSTQCKTQFDANPAKYVSSAGSARREPET